MTCAVLLAKDPVPGQVKTRLQPRMTAAQAATVAAAFLRDSSELLAASTARRKVVAFAPASAGDSVRRLLGEVAGFVFEPQQPGSLGQRMAAACEAAFAAGCQRVVMIGADSPSLPPAWLDDGLRRLQTADVVLAPSVDGGYCLLGLRAEARAAAAPALFDGIEWSTGRVLEQTVAALPVGLQLDLLPPWYDVDVPEEAAFLRSHLQALARGGEPGRGRHSRQALAGLDLPPPS